MPVEFPVGDLNDHFEELDVHEKVTEGGYKSVYKADYKGQEVALKLLETESRIASRRADREIKAMKEVDSPLLVDLIDSFPDEIQDTSILVIIENFVEGKTLREKIRDGEHSLDLGLFVGESLLKALEAFEECDREIIHRDIKPSNIIINDDEFTLLDLGVARFPEDDTLTPTDWPRAPGTKQYSAPEQLKNRKEEQQDNRTDLFSTGIVMFESLTGEHPFDTSEEMPIHYSILSDERKEYTGYIGDTSLEGKINEFYLKLTENQRYKRFNKPQYALEKLEEILGDR